MSLDEPIRRPTLKTLARELGLSVTTVSRALKDGPEVRPETVARVKAAAETLGYRPDWRAVTLRTGRSGMLAVLFYSPPAGEDVGDASVATLMDGICRRLGGMSFMPMVRLHSTAEEGFEHVRQIVEGKLADGVILSGTTPQDARVRYMLERRFPFVTFGRTELVTPHPWCDVDNELAARQATAFAAAQGRRRIALLDPPAELTFARHRGLGYRRALAEAGLPFDPALVVNDQIGAATARAAARRLLAADAPPDAIVCATSVVALGALSAVRGLGLTAQRDVLLVSRDGARLCDYLDPPLPGCFASLAEVGATLCDLLLRALEGEPAERLQRLLSTELRLPPAA